MKLTVKRLTICSLLTAAALALSYLENVIPITAAVPVPGMKLGLANIVMIFAVCTLSKRETFLILTARCLLGSMFAGNMSALIFSLMGGVLAVLVMMLLTRLRKLSVYGVSVAGAAAHNCGQVAAAVVMLGSTAPVYYLPALLAASLVTGALTGMVAACLLRTLDRSRALEMDT